MAFISSTPSVSSQTAFRATSLGVSHGLPVRLTNPLSRRTNVPKMQMRRGGPPPVPISDRVLSILPYLIPLMDSLSFGRFVFAKVPIVGQLLLPPLVPLYSIYRGIPFLAFGVFLALYILVVRNTNISRYIRFNTSQALILDIALIVPQLFQGINLNIPVTITETLSTAVFYAIALAVIYVVVRNVQGLLPDEIPGVSDSVYQQIGPY